MTLCSVDSAEKYPLFDSLLAVSFSKDTKEITNLCLALRGTPAANTTITGLRPCSRCSFESEVQILVSFWKETSPKENQMMTLLCRVYNVKCHALLKIQYQ